MVFSAKQAGAMLVMATCAAVASAGEITYDFSGFGTAGYAWSDTDKGQLIRDRQPRGADSSGDIGLDSLLGVQGTVHFTPQISATVQVMARRSTDVNYTLDPTLAFLKDQLTDDFAVRVGRLQLPAFMVSEFREVGYANTFVRPPLEVYGQLPLDSVDGVDAQYTHSLGPVEISALGFYGGADRNTSGTSVSLKKFCGGNLTATWGPLSLHYGRVMGRLTLDASGTSTLIDAIGAAGFTTLADYLSTNNRATTFADYGLSLDWHNLLVQGEYTQSAVGGFIPDTRGRYVLVGYRFHKFTPYVSYAQQNPISPTTDATIPQVGALAPLSQAANALLAAYRQHTSSAGIRWDFHDSMDLKLQIDHISPDGPGLFANVQPGFKGPVTVAALAVDFVF